MKFFKLHLQHYVYRKMLLSYILIVTLTVTLVSTTLFWLFSDSTAKEISNTSKAMLSQTSYTADLVYEQVQSIGNTLVNDNTIYNVMYAQKRDPVKEYQAVRRLSQISYVYPFIKYIGIYNSYTKIYLTSLGIPIFPELDADVISRITNNTERKYIDFFPRKSLFTDSSLNPNDTINVLTFILYPNYSFALPPRSAIIINVDESYIQNTIQGMSNTKENNIFVVDAKGTVLSHTKSDYFLEDFSHQPFVQHILNSSLIKGHIIEVVNGTKQLVTFVKSEGPDWYFISMQPYYHLLSNISTLGNITLTIAITLIIIGIFLSLRLTTNLYNPLRNLLNRISSLADGAKRSLTRYNEYELLSEAFSNMMNRTNSLEASLERAYPVFKETWMRNLLMGNIDNITNTISLVKDIENELGGPYFCVFILKIDNYLTFQNTLSSTDQSLYRFAVCNVSQELMERHFDNHAFSMEDDQIVLLAQLSESSIPNSMYLTLSQIQDVLMKHFKVSLSISIGDIVSEKRNIHRSYQSALEYSNYRFFYGHQSIIYYDKIKDQLDRTEEYPTSIEKQLLNALESTDQKGVEKELSRFTKYLRQLSYHHALVYSNQLVISISRYFTNILDTKENSSKYYNVIYKLSQLETIAEVNEAIKTYCLDILNIMNENKNTKNSDKVRKVQEYLQKYYSDPNLSLELVAERVDLSPGYFSKIFKNVTNTSFNDYLNKLRLEKAKDLLVTTSEPISSICEKVGILNTTYFYTLFKKVYRMTPSQYRKHNNEKN